MSNKLIKTNVWVRGYHSRNGEWCIDRHFLGRDVGHPDEKPHKWRYNKLHQFCVNMANFVLDKIERMQLDATEFPLLLDVNNKHRRECIRIDRSRDGRYAMSGCHVEAPRMLEEVEMYCLLTRQLETAIRRVGQGQGTPMPKGWPPSVSHCWCDDSDPPVDIDNQ